MSYSVSYKSTQYGSLCKMFKGKTSIGLFTNSTIQTPLASNPALHAVMLPTERKFLHAHQIIVNSGAANRNWILYSTAERFHT